MKRISNVLSGEVPIPDSALRQNSKRDIQSAPIVPNEYIVTSLIQEVHQSGKNITFLQFMELCEAEFKLKEVREKIGL